MKKLLLLLAIFITMATSAWSQYFQYSLFEYAPYRYNPAKAAVYNASVAEAVFRDQKTGGGFHIQSSSVSLSQPLWRKDNTKIGTIGFSALDDRSGAMGYFRNNEMAAAFSKSVKLNESQSLNVGVKASYHSRRISTEDFYTAAQYVSYRGFDQNLPSGEALSALNASFWSSSVGVMWYKGNPREMGNSYLGLSFYDIAKGTNTSTELPQNSSKTITGSAGWGFKPWNRIALIPEVLFTYSQKNMNASVGPLLQVSLNSNNSDKEFVGLSVKYITTGEISSAFTFNKSNLQWSAAYELKANQYNPAHLGAFEIGLRYLFLIKEPKKKKPKKDEPKGIDSKGINIKPDKKKDKKEDWKEEYSRQLLEKKVIQKAAKERADSINFVATKIEEEAKQKNTAEVIPGPISQMIIIPDSVYHLRFQTDKHHADSISTEILENVLFFLEQFEDSKVIVTGHTDNVGSENYNLKLSYRRAETIKELLMEAGIAEERIIIDGRGSSEPISTNHHHEGRTLNRRVDIRIEY